MKLLTTLLLLFMTTFMNAQDLTTDRQAIVANAEAIADEFDDSQAETTNIFIDYDDDNGSKNEGKADSMVTRVSLIGKAKNQSDDQEHGSTDQNSPTLCLRRFLQ